MGKEEADRRAGGRPGPGVTGAGARRGGAGRRRGPSRGRRGKAEARGACLGRRGREGGGCRCALGAVCARSSAQGGRWPRRESWGDACGPRRLGWGRRSEPDGAAARQARGRAVRALPPPPRRPPPHCRWRRGRRVPAPGARAGARGSPAKGWAAPPASTFRRAA